MATEKEQDRVPQAVLELPRRLRRPFVMVHVRGMSFEEVASSLHLSPRALERRLVRALVRCRERTRAR